MVDSKLQEELKQRKKDHDIQTQSENLALQLNEVCSRVAAFWEQVRLVTERAAEEDAEKAAAATAEKPTAVGKTDPKKKTEKKQGSYSRDSPNTYFLF